MFDCYCDGVNVGLGDFVVWLWEYFLFGMWLQLWWLEDSLLVIVVMYLDFNSDGGNMCELCIVQMCVVLLCVVVDFLFVFDLDWEVLFIGMLL